jgi:outer membrane protein assembly factor BamB
VIILRKSATLLFILSMLIIFTACSNDNNEAIDNKENESSEEEKVTASPNIKGDLKHAFYLDEEIGKYDSVSAPYIIGNKAYITFTYYPNNVANINSERKHIKYVVDIESGKLISKKEGYFDQGIDHTTNTYYLKNQDGITIYNEKDEEILSLSNNHKILSISNDVIATVKDRNILVISKISKGKSILIPFNTDIYGQGYYSEEENVYYLSTSNELDSELYAIDVETGKTKWKFTPGSSFPANLIVKEENIIFHVENIGTEGYLGPEGVYVLDKETGDVRWSKLQIDDYHYIKSSGENVIFTKGFNRKDVIFYDINTGKETWNSEESSTPITAYIDKVLLKSEQEFIVVGSNYGEQDENVFEFISINIEEDKYNWKTQSLVDPTYQLLTEDGDIYYADNTTIHGIDSITGEHFVSIPHGPRGYKNMKYIDGKLIFTSIEDNKGVLYIYE